MAYAPFPLVESPFAANGIAQKKDPGTFLPDLNVRLMCPDCKIDPPNIREEFASGDLVCGDCGLVLGDRIVDTRSEWRTFANDEGDDPSRVGAAVNPLLDNIEQTDTIIGSRDGGTGFARDLQRTATKAVGARQERSIIEAFRNISNMADQISLSRNIADIAKQLFKRVDEEKLLRGKSQEAIIAACIFVACRQGRVPRTFREICALTNVPKKQIGQCYKALEAAFGTSATGIAAGANGVDHESAATTGARDLITRFCNHLALRASIQAMAMQIVDRSRDLGVLAGRSPISIAAACIYFSAHACGTPKTAKEIGNVASVSDVTIKSSYKELLRRKDEIVKKEWIAAGKLDVRRLPAN